MATPIKRIEKEYYLKAVFDNKLPLKCYYERAEYVFTLEKITKDEMWFHMNRPIGQLKPKDNLDFMFEYQGHKIFFTVGIRSVKDTYLVSGIPDSIYQNLNRSFSRIHIPSELRVQLSFLGDRYYLSYPQIVTVEPEKISSFFKNFDLHNFSELINQMAKWINGYASGYKLVFFKNVTPNSVEEQVIADTGKILYLPSKSANLPQTDPFPQKRIITEEMFKLFLEHSGTDPAGVNDACARFVAAKYNSGIVSDAWVPVLFQEYVAGYIHIWLNDNEAKPPFDFKMIDMMYQFAKVVAHSLKMNGFFEQGNMKNKPLEGNIIDISVSGILFAFPQARFASTLLQGSKLAVKLISPRRSISSESTIVRCFTDNAMGYFGCQFLEMAPEDMRFLFEFLYGRPFTDADMKLYGQV